MTGVLLDDAAVTRRIFEHIDRGTTDLGAAGWREPVANYRSEARLARELELAFRPTPTPFCPSAALPEAGSFIARAAGGTSLFVARGHDGRPRAFRNACRHRGAEVACGEGRVPGFVCRYHGWTYGLDGKLVSVPHEEGFPGLDKAERGLVPLACFERGGLVFVGQAGQAQVELPFALESDLQLLAIEDRVVQANWKIAAEGFLEGYHIRHTHRETFYPVQFDNLNVVESFGRNSRIAFPYRNVEKLRAIAPEERRVTGTLTYVYHLFPNVIIATFPHRVVMVALEPVSVSATRFVTYTMGRGRSEKTEITKDEDFVDAGAREDREMVESIQRSLSSEANDYFEFGRFEGAIVHLHRNLTELVA